MTDRPTDKLLLTEFPGLIATDPHVATAKSVGGVCPIICLGLEGANMGLRVQLDMWYVLWPSGGYHIMTWGPMYVLQWYLWGSSYFSVLSRARNS